MDSITNAELLELFFVSNEFIESQFQYWLSISFAAIIATSIVGERMANPIRYTLIVLYVMATVLFLLRYISAVEEFRSIATEASLRNIVGDRGEALARPTLILRSALFLIGASATIWFLHHKGKGMLGSGET